MLRIIRKRLHPTAQLRLVHTEIVRGERDPERIRELVLLALKESDQRSA
jgi:hypothetical protein